MSPEELTQLEAQANTLFTEASQAYKRIPPSIRYKQGWAQMKGYYEDQWPYPKPETVVQFLAAHERWAEVHRQIIDAHPINLKLSKVRRSQ